MNYQRISVDLHLHSILSPCGDDMMTPCNLVGMAKLNGLDAIAVTDHNAMENVETALKVGQAYEIVVVPGMELETSEEIHVVCLFPNIEGLAKFQQIVIDSYGENMPKNRPDIFGRQAICNDDDEVMEQPYIDGLQPSALRLSRVALILEPHLPQEIRPPKT